MAARQLTPLPPLVTRRLTLAALRLEDAGALFAFAGDPEIGRLSGAAVHGSAHESRKAICAGLVDARVGGSWEWGVRRREDGALIGVCGFDDLDADGGVARLHYALAKPHWGQGYATEAAAAVLDFGFGPLGLRLVEASAFPENLRSLRVLCKLGMRRQDSPDAFCVWQIGRDDWRAARPRSVRKSDVTDLMGDQDASGRR